LNTIKDITLNDGSVIFIEMEEVNQEALPQVTRSEHPEDLPPGAELTSSADKVVDTLESLKGTLGTVFSTIRDSIKENAPDEWGVELNIGFKGKVNPIPIIVGAESNVALKIHAKWKKT
tara:strand:+ start:2337 stop:2693 length:357 start_codon:yes stop_codon:yes gene_type:complete